MKDYYLKQIEHEKFQKAQSLENSSKRKEALALYDEIIEEVDTPETVLTWTLLQAASMQTDKGNFEIAKAYLSKLAVLPLNNYQIGRKLLLEFNLHSMGQSIKQALNNAKRRLIKEKIVPEKIWAAFTLIGH